MSQSSGYTTGATDSPGSLSVSVWGRYHYILSPYFHSIVLPISRTDS